MISTYDQKESIREIAASIRMAADAMSRAAELLSRWETVEDDSEMAELRSTIDGLVRRNASLAEVIATDRFEAAIAESRILKLWCDCVSAMRPVGRLRTQLVERSIRSKFPWEPRPRTGANTESLPEGPMVSLETLVKILTICQKTPNASTPESEHAS